MSGFNYSNLVTDIRNYTEVDSNVLTAALINRFIEDAEFKILRDVPLDAYKKQSTANLVTGQHLCMKHNFIRILNAFWFCSSAMSPIFVIFHEYL